MSGLFEHPTTHTSDATFALMSLGGSSTPHTSGWLLGDFNGLCCGLARFYWILRVCCKLLYHLARFCISACIRKGDLGLTGMTRQANLGFHGARKTGRFALVARNEGGGEKTLSPRVHPTSLCGLPSCRLGFVCRCAVRAGSDLYQSESILYHLTTARRRRSGDTPALRSLVLQI